MKERIKWYLIKVLESCETEYQKDNALFWISDVIKRKKIYDKDLTGFSDWYIKDYLKSH